MWVRHKCTICKGTGKIKKEECDCLVLPDYMKIFPDAEWQDSTMGVWHLTEIKALIYAVGDGGCCTITDQSDVIVNPIGQLNECMIPRTVAELNVLCSALKLKILYLEK